MSDVDQIKDKIDIVDLISEYVQLKASGINHKGRCPFHNEKTPSFMVNRERQFFKCFGCGKNGDIFTFVEEMEGMEFPEALRYLANKAGVQLTNNFKSEVNGSQKNRIKDINSAAASFFYNFLLKMDAAKMAREYLKNRGLVQDTIDEWQIGYVPEQWDLLTKYLLKKGHSIDDLVASGLTIKRDGADASSGRGFYDRFRGRIMFPIWDVHGGVVGFTGRVLVETEKSGGKYVNTPQTIVYDKSRVVFGLNKAKREIKSQDLVVMCEGQMDVIACHQAGMKNVVASSGTALTDHQIKLLKRYSNNMNMAFDMDDAGIKAAKRGIELAVAEGINVKVIQIPDGAGKDPDECIEKDKEVWFECVKNAKTVMDWYFERAFKNRDINNPKDKQNIANELLVEISHIPFAVEKDYWIQKLSSDLRVDVSVLREDLNHINTKTREKIKIKSVILESKESAQGGSALGGEIKTEVVDVKKTRSDILVEQLFILLLKFPDLIKNANIFDSTFSIQHPTFKSLYDSLKTMYNEKKVDLDRLRQICDTGNNTNIIDIILLQGESEFSDFTADQAKKEIEKLVVRIKEESLKIKRERLQREIIEAEKNGDENLLNKLMQEFSELK